MAINIWLMKPKLGRILRGRDRVRVGPRPIPRQIAEAQRGRSALLTAQKLAGTPPLQIGFGDAEPSQVSSMTFNRRRAFLRFAGGNEDAIGVTGAAAHPASQLMQLRQPKLLGVFHHP